MAMVALSHGQPLAGIPVGVVGASGYVGRLLAPALLAAGAEVTAVARRQEALSGMLGVRRACAHALDPVALRQALDGSRIVYDLVPPGAGAVSTLTSAAVSAGAERIVRVRCLGAFEQDEDGFGPAVTVVRAGPVIGAGAPWVVALRRLAERLPLVPCAHWMDGRTQPVSAADLVRCLIAIGVWDAGAGEIVDIAGPDVVSYRALLADVAAITGRRRRLVDVPLAGGRIAAVALRLAAGGDPPVGRLLRPPAREAVARRAWPSSLLPLPATPLHMALRAAIASTRRRAG